MQATGGFAKTFFSQSLQLATMKDGTELDNDGESREAVVVGKYFEEISRPNTPIGQKS